MDRQTMLKQMLSIGVTDHFCMFCPNIDSLIIRGGTKEHSFRVPFDIKLARKMRISYKQEGRLILEKNLRDVQVLGDNLIHYELSETDTLKFKADSIVTVQMRVELTNHKVITSEIFEVDVVDVIDDRELSDESTHYYAIEAEVKDQRVKVANYFDLVTRSTIYKCRFYFDSTWKKFIKIAVFTDDYNHKIYAPIKEVNGIYECHIPDLIVNSPGWIHVGVFGMITEGVETFNKPTVWSNAVRVKQGCNDCWNLVIDDVDITSENRYVYCGSTDDLNAIVPSKLDLVPGTIEDWLRDGITWKHYDENDYLEGSYRVLAIPDYMKLKCTEMQVGEFKVPITCENKSAYDGYRFYYFSSPIVGNFTCKYILKEETNG